jgi:hypothetical protein
MLFGSVGDSVWGAQEEVIIAKRKRNEKRVCFMKSLLTDLIFEWKNYFLSLVLGD